MLCLYQNVGNFGTYFKHILMNMIKFFFVSIFCVVAVLASAQGDYEQNIYLVKNNYSLFESTDTAHVSERSNDFRHFKFLDYQSKKNEAVSLFNVSPLYLASTGYDTYKKQNITQTGLGAMLDARLFKNKLSINAKIFQFSGNFPTYLDSVISKTNMIPYAGYAHPLGKNSYYYWNNSFSLSYKASNNFTITFANDRNFIGNGYRSLLLSNNANNYPHLKIEAKLWHFKYKAIFANFYDIRFADGKFNKFQNKYGAIHYVQWQVVKKLQLSFFEAIMFQSRNAKGFGYDINYLNPIIFYRPVEYSLGSADNALLGGNLLWDIKSNFSVYSQIILDEFLLSAIKARKGWVDNKQGLQIGIKTSQKIGKHLLNILAEFNYLRPFIYSHRNTIQNYANYGMPLAHPYGGNFYEVLGTIKYRPAKYFQINGTVSYALIGYDQNGISYGQSINNSYIIRVKYNQQDEGNKVGQGLTTKQVLLNINAFYGLNKTNNTCINAGLMVRATANINTKVFSAYPYIGISTLVFKNGGLF